jgi:hypothetical protein
MKAEPIQRRTAAQALEHPWVTRISGFTSGMNVLEGPAPDILVSSVALSGNDQTTQASGQWTQTVPIRSHNTQASAAWTETIEYSADQRSIPSPIDQTTLRQRTPDIATNRTHDESAIMQNLQPTSLKQAQANLHQSVQRFEEAADKRRQEKPHKPEVEHDILDSFKQFSAAEKLRISERQRTLKRESKDVKLNDLKRFGEKFHLKTPVPADLVSVLAKDEEKQKKIVESALQQARKYQNGTPKGGQKITPLLPRGNRQQRCGPQVYQRPSPHYQLQRPGCECRLNNSGR